MKKIFNALILSFTLILGTIAFTGCSEKILWVGNSFPGHMNASYASFTGTENKNFKLDEGATAAFTYDSKVDKGTLSIKVLDPDKETVLELETNQKGTKELKAEKSGKYTLAITGDKTGGSYDISWEVK